MAVTATMPKHESPQVFELDDSVVRECSCLIALFALDADSDMGCLNHVNVIEPITDAKSELLVS